MICGQFHAGSGLGDQLMRYITVRTLAEEKGVKWGMYHPENFKGEFFTNFDGGIDPLLNANKNHTFAVFLEKNVQDENGTDIRSFDPESQFIEDNTIIDGSFEDSKYWHHNLKNIDEWLKVKPLNVPDNRCIIGFRGGEYALYPDLFLPKSYYKKAIEEMLKIDPNMEFEIHTDDPVLALTYFPEFPIIDNTQISHSKHTNMSYNWRAARYAKYAIIPNSAFFILPRILRHHHNHGAVTLAPRGWASHNKKDGTWGRPAAFYREFTYVRA